MTFDWKKKQALTVTWPKGSRRGLGTGKMKVQTPGPVGKMWVELMKEKSNFPEP